jgi:hypothetical protein
MERPTGPLGAATQSTGRPMVDNGALNRQALSNTARRAPNPTLHLVPSNQSLSAQTPITVSQVIDLAKEAMKNALEENETKAAEASGVSNELKPGVTIDLSHKNIQIFPDEVVDIIKNELERYCSYLEWAGQTIDGRQAGTLPQPYLYVPAQIFRMYLFALPQCSQQRYT